MFTPKACYIELIIDKSHFNGIQTFHITLDFHQIKSLEGAHVAAVLAETNHLWCVYRTKRTERKVRVFHSCLSHSL